jgi:hypothetical protein
MRDTHISDRYGAALSALDGVTGRYGESSNAALMLRLELLLEQLCDPLASAEDWEPLRRRIEEHYTLEAPPPSLVVDCITVARNFTGQKLYQFDPGEYSARYGTDFSDLGKRIMRISTAKDLRQLADRAWYLYAVTEGDTLVVFDAPMDVTELVSNRTMLPESAIPIVHPTLVHAHRFTVKAAGELAIGFIDGEPSAAIVNSKSGHFCPDPDSLLVAVATLQRYLGAEARIATVPVKLRLPAEQL